MKIIALFLLSCLTCHVKCEKEHGEKDLIDDSPKVHPTENCYLHDSSLPQNPENVFFSNANSEKRNCAPYPQYEDIISNNFTCEGKPYMPGFYADLETNCQAFHICYNSIVEHFLCPVGTIFDQKNLVCNHWKRVQCPLSSLFYRSNLNIFQETADVLDQEVRNSIKSKLIAAAQSPNVTNTVLEGNESKYLKLLILTQLMEVSDVLSDVLKVQISEEKEKLGSSQRFGRSSEIINQYLSMIIAEVFPLLPVKFDVSLLDGLSKQPPITNRTRQPRSIHDFKENPHNIPQLILDITDDTCGIISGVSRNVLVLNYISFFTKLHLPKDRE